jgi:hypothetical protein
MPTDRRTVDLSMYPDLVVIYLGMRVNVLTGFRTLLGFGPKIEAAARERPPGLLHHEAFLFSLFPRMPAFGSTGKTSTRSNGGRAAIRIGRGGKTSCKTLKVRASGMRRTECKAESKRSTTISQSRLGCLPLLP